MITKDDIIKGRMVENDREIVLDKMLHEKIKDDMYGEHTFKSAGINDISDLIGKKVYITDDLSYEVVGISDGGFITFEELKYLTANTKYYCGDNTWLEQKYPNRKLLLPFTKVEVPDFELKMDNGINDDFDNMVTLYENLKFLTDSQASDERLWSGMAHTIF